VVKWLVEERGCDPDRGTADGTTAFCWAAWQNHEPVCRYLASRTQQSEHEGLVLSCNPHSVNSYGCNAAMWACQGEASVALCSFLLNGLGVSFGLLNDSGQGCLHKAAQRGRRDVCEWLLLGEKTPNKNHGNEDCDAGQGGEANDSNEDEGSRSKKRNCGLWAQMAANAEGSKPSDLARFNGHLDLADFLQRMEIEVEEEGRGTRLL